MLQNYLLNNSSSTNFCIKQRKKGISSINQLSSPNEILISLFFSFVIFLPWTFFAPLKHPFFRDIHKRRDKNRFEQLVMRVTRTQFVQMILPQPYTQNDISFLTPKRNALSLLAPLFIWSKKKNLSRQRTILGQGKNKKNEKILPCSVREI